MSSMSPAFSRDMLSVAPMMECTTPQFRYFFRGLSRRTRLYTEMVVSTTLVYNPSVTPAALTFDECEHPVALQLGGSDPEHLRIAMQLARPYKFDEINLNCGCPSNKVANKSCFGARLMLDPERVRDCVSAMREEACRFAEEGDDLVPEVTVKCRLGADDMDTYEEFANFVRVVSESGVRHFIVHARKCWLNGLSTKENRTIPPLRYEWVERAGEEFPHLRISINGGITDMETIERLLANRFRRGDGTDAPVLDSAMVGRQAYNDPWMFAAVDEQIFGERNPGLSRREVVERYLTAADGWEADAWCHDPKEMKHHIGGSATEIAKPVLRFFHGCRGGAKFRRSVSEAILARRRRMQKEPCEGAPTPSIGTMIRDFMEEHIPTLVLEERPPSAEASAPVAVAGAGAIEETKDSSELESEESPKMCGYA